MNIEKKLQDLGEWYHKIDLGDGIYTPGTRNQSLTYNIYKEYLPENMEGLTVLDLGANACGFSIEFAKRGATVVAIEHNDLYIKQAEFVINHLGLEDKFKLIQNDVFSAINLGQFDIVLYVGLSYHLRYPQLAMDMIGRLCKSKLLCSTQLSKQDGLLMENRARAELKTLQGWEPTELTFSYMIKLANFKNIQVVSRSPHKGEEPRNKLGNAIYFYAEAPDSPVLKLPFLD